MVFVYRQKSSSSARELSEALGACRFRARTIPISRKVKRGDVVVCWGEQLDPIDGVRILNGAPIASKYADAIRLKEKGVPTVEVSRTRPVATVPGPAPVDPALALMQRAQELAETFGELTMPVPIPHGAAGPLFAGVGDLRTVLEQLHIALRVAAPVAPQVQQAEWIGRMNNHVGGNDLLNPPGTPEFWAKKETLINEYRIHSFGGKSIRAGKKALRDGFRPTVGGGTMASTWVRSWDGGWRILYDGVSSKQKHRDLAHKAVEALGLQFGAVDIGERADGSLIVLEVNRAPGLEGGTITAYEGAIQRWVDGVTGGAEA